MPSSTLLALATAISAVNAAYQGFNYGSTFTNGQAKAQTDFEAEFKTAAGLDGTNGAFTSARLYTMIQDGTTNTPISAIPAAISTKTSLLFGMWASAGDAAFANELAALQNTISQYCGQLDGLVAGISIGSEDLYRITPTGIASNAGPGAQPGTLVNYINQVRDTVKGSCLADVPIGHVDTWNAWVLDSNKPVIDAVDWLGMDTYPYYENTNSNGIANAKSLYEAALTKIQNAGPGKDVWVTETGWPVSGANDGDAVASLANAQTYWQQVGCPNFGKVNIWWYTLQDAEPDTPNPSFGLIGNQLTETPLFDLSCKGVDTNPTQPTSSSSSSSASSKPVSTSAAASSTKAASSTPGSSSAPASTTTTTTTTTTPEQQSTTTTSPAPQSTSSEAQTTTTPESQTTNVPSQTTGSGSSQTSTSEPQSTASESSGSSGSQTTGSEDQTTGSAAAATTTSVPSTFVSVPFPTSNSTASSAASGTGSAPSGPTSSVPGSSGTKLGSFGAAVAAVAVAAFAL